jgi:hypothetical protein
MHTMPTEKGSRSFWPFALLLVVAAAIAIDLYGPQKTEFRSFDPNQAAQIETSMWRSYCGGQRLNLFFQTAHLLRTEYHLPFLRSHVAAWSATKADFIFKDGSNMADYRKALLYLGRYCIILRNVSKIRFDPLEARQLEFNWRVIDRERAKHAPADLERAIAALAAEIYQAPPERFMEYAHLRAQAMLLRDDKAQAGGVSEADWQKIGELLRASWQALQKAVGP